MIQITFGLIKKIYIELLAGLVNAPNLQNEFR